MWQSKAHPRTITSGFLKSKLPFSFTSSTVFCCISAPSVLQLVLSQATAQPAEFSEAVTMALSAQWRFNFGRDVLPREFRGLLENDKYVIDIGKPTEEPVKNVVENT